MYETTPYKDVYNDIFYHMPNEIINIIYSYSPPKNQYLEDVKKQKKKRVYVNENYRFMKYKIQNINHLCCNYYDDNTKIKRSTTIIERFYNYSYISFSSIDQKRPIRSYKETKNNLLYHYVNSFDNFYSYNRKALLTALYDVNNKVFFNKLSLFHFDKAIYKLNKQELKNALKIYFN